MKTALAIVISVFLSGCSSYYAPNPNRYSLDQITEFTSEDSVELINSQFSVERFEFIFNNGFDSWKTDLRSTTDALVVILDRELSKRGMDTSGSNDSDQKAISIAVTAVEAHSAWIDIPTTITMSVELGNGYKRVYVSNATGKGVLPSFDRCATRAIADLLSDPDVVEYLTDTSERTRQSSLPSVDTSNPR